MKNSYYGKVVVLKQSRFSEFLLGFVLIGSTVAISPWTNYDPINIPKLMVLVAGSFMTIPFLISSSRNWRSSFQGRFFIFLCTIFALSSLGVMLTNSAPLDQQFWGTWGRSNGFLCFLALLIVFTHSISLGYEGKAERTLRNLVVAGYAVSLYALLQYLELDPLPWSQKQPFAFLGNINFMSSFLGFVNVYLFSKIVLERLSASTRVYFLSLYVVNLLLIAFSGSIQGLGITAIGFVTTLIFFLISQSKLALAKFTMCIFALLGVLTLLGTAGVGPLGKTLVQQTVLYRTDYWRTGIETFLRNPLNGVGLDSFGDYYREYRDVLAATRTGPQRIVNTSHNVIIDLFANGGFFVGITFSVMVSVAIFLLVSKSIRPTGTTQIRHLTSLVLGWIFFMLISINQIGVTVWGFAFMGLGIGITIFEGKKTQGPVPIQGPPRSGKENALVFSILYGLIGFALVLFPLRADSLVLSAIKQGDVEGLKAAVSMLGATGFHQDKYLESILNANGLEAAIPEARRLVKSDPRNLYAWSLIFSGEGLVSDAERKNAIESMLRLDPNNKQIQSDYLLFIELKPQDSE